MWIYRLETDHFVELRDQFRSVDRHCKLGILVGQLFLGYPATAGTQPSNVNRDFGRDYFGHQVLEGRKAHAMHILHHRVVHQHPGITHQDYSCLMPGLQRSIGHEKWKSRLGRVFAPMHSNKKLTCHNSYLSVEMIFPDILYAFIIIRQGFHLATPCAARFKNLFQRRNQTHTSPVDAPKSNHWNQPITAEAKVQG
jgi:hypothetical protein